MRRGGAGREVTPPGTRIPLSEFQADLDRLRRGEVDVARAGDVYGAGHASGRSAERSMRGHLIAPMRWEQELMGSLNLGTDRDEPFTDEHVAIAVEAANHLAVAIRQTLLHQRVTAASAAKSAFLTNLSHELRTPLNAVIGYTDLLLQRTEDPVALADLERIQLAASGLVALVSDILDLAKSSRSRTRASASRPISCRICSRCSRRRIARWSRRAGAAAWAWRSRGICAGSWAAISRWRPGRGTARCSPSACRGERA